MSYICSNQPCNEFKISFALIHICKKQLLHFHFFCTILNELRTLNLVLKLEQILNQETNKSFKLTMKSKQGMNFRTCNIQPKDGKLGVVSFLYNSTNVNIRFSFVSTFL